uniref:Uncharacterized protein n=1 Tax=Trichogramma kaykai TaxID=54128 RepID=A0ABD2W206_9HYME
MVKPDLSFYDMMQSTPENAPKFAYEVYFKIARDHKIRYLSGYEETCTQHLCEIMLRGFFRRWTPAIFWQLIHYRLPILCCDMIIEVMDNKDLFNICMAVAAGQN